MNNNSSSSTSNTKRKRDEPQHNHSHRKEEKSVGKEGAAVTDVEKRMYEAVRKAGRMHREGGVMGEHAKKTGASGGDYQVMGTSELAKLVAGGSGGKKGRK
jgi:hypothetical protein